MFHTTHGLTNSPITRKIMVPLKHMSTMASNRLLWSRDYKVTASYQPSMALTPTDTAAEVTLKGMETDIAKFTSFLHAKGIIV